MRITTKEVETFKTVTDKLTRIFAFKYQVMTKDISFIFKGKVLHVLIEGKIKQSFSNGTLHAFCLSETTLEVYRGL